MRDATVKSSEIFRCGKTSEAIKTKDEVQIMRMNRNQLIDRLLADVCELCGKSGKVEGHHINKLKNLKKKRKLELWEERMITIKQKTLFVCGECHRSIHNGTYDGKNVT